MSAAELWVRLLRGLATLLPLLVLLAATAAVGAALVEAAAPAAGPRRRRLPLAVLAGQVAFAVLLLGLDLGGVAWSRRTLAVGLGLVLAVAVAVARARRSTAVAVAPAPGPVPFGWGDALALLPLAAFAAAAWSRRIAIPDFVYHWGVKGKHSFWAHGIDWSFLSDPLGLANHPDYPNLLPDLYAATAIVRGRFEERAMLLWSVVFAALAVAFARRALAAGGVRRHPLQAGVAAVACTVAFFGIGYDAAGGGDLPLAAALLAALPALVGAPAAEGAAADDLRVGLAAAFAAGVKIEGMALAAFLVTARFVHGLPAGGGLAAVPSRRALPRLGRLALPPALVAVPWAVGVLGHHLFSPTNAGALDAGRWPAVAEAARSAFSRPEWHGLPWLLALVPALLVVRRTRAAAAVLLLQAGFYLWVYLSAPLDPGLLVRNSLPRLLLHLVPAALVCTLVALSPAVPAATPRDGSPGGPEALPRGA